MHSESMHSLRRQTEGLRNKKKTQRYRYTRRSEFLMYSVKKWNVKRFSFPMFESVLSVLKK